MSDPAATDGIRSGLLTFGETMGLISTVDIGQLDHARDARISIGGAESNVAIGVARLGQPVTFITRVGRDAVGDLIIRRLRADGVTASIARDDAFTGIMVRHSRTGSAITVDYHRAGSAGSTLTPSDVPADVIRRCSLVHLTGITPALSLSARATTTTAITVARHYGVPVSIDVNYRSKLWAQERARVCLTDLIAAATITFAGIEEAQLVLNTTTTDPLTLAHQLCELGPSEAVIKDGVRGCTAVIDGTEYQLPALPVVAVDPVGAGDAFVAGYLAERLAGHPAEQRLRTAIAVGAFAVTVPGDCELLPTRDDLTNLATTSDVHR